MEDIIKNEIIETEIDEAEVKQKKRRKKKEEVYWYYEDLKDYTNEQIVKMIQETDNKKYWEELHKRTVKLYSAVLRDKVHSYYKEHMLEDVSSVLKIGWIKAVKTYNEEKATADFVAYCSFLMEQNYIMFARRITKDKIGNSVRDEILSCVMPDGCEENEKMTQGCADIILKYDCEKYNQIESSIYVQNILNKLKLEDETQYMIIKKHYIDGMTQKDLGVILNMSQSAISRHIKKGMMFLKHEIEKERIMLANMKKQY